MENKNTRRDAMKKIVSGAAVAATGLSISNRLEAADNQMIGLKGKINHSTCRWCYSSIEFEELCKAAKTIGLQSIELTGPAEWDILKKYDLTAAIGWGDYPKGMGITNFFNKIWLL